MAEENAPAEVWLAFINNRIRRQLTFPREQRDWATLANQLGHPPDSLRDSWQLKLLQTDFVAARACDDGDANTAADVCDGFGVCQGVSVTCNDGVVDPGEECDDGSGNSDTDSNAEKSPLERCSEPRSQKAVANPRTLYLSSVCRWYSWHSCRRLPATKESSKSSIGIAMTMNS